MGDDTWKNGKWIPSDPGDYSDLVAKNEDGTFTSLKQLCHTVAAKILYIWTAPSNDESKSMNVLKSRALNWAVF